MRHIERHGRGRTARFGEGRLKFKSTHRAAADVHEALQRRDLFGSSSMPGQVFIDEGIAERVWERVSQESWQAVKSARRQFRKAEPVLGFELHA